jgi:two-component system invasion response regulator UvrY
MFANKRPDVIVMDLSMPGIGGLEASRRILERDPAAKIVIFSVHENALFLKRTLEQGVLGYLSKRSASSEMIEAVRTAARGDSFIGRDLIGLLAETVRTNHVNLLDELTPREFEIFRLMAEGKGPNEIGKILALSPKTVSNHYTHIKQKLGLSNKSDLTRMAIRAGVITP